MLPVFFREKDGEDLTHLTLQQVGQYFDGQDILVRLRFAHDKERPGKAPPGAYIGEAVINKTDLAFLELKTSFAGEPMSSLKITYDPDFWRGEERLLQLPVDESLQIQVQQLLDIPGMRPDTVSRDSSK